MTIIEGTSVRIIARGRRAGQVGTVAAIVEGQYHPYAVAGLAEWYLWFSADQLEPMRATQDAAA